MNFDGVTTATIRASGNVSSVTRNGTGDYTVNFATAMPDANYAVSGSTVGEPTFWANQFLSNTVAPTTTSVGIRTWQPSNNLDSAFVHVVIHR